MANGNHNKEQVRKKCPILNEWCIGDACAMRPEMRRNVGGLQQTFNVCWVDALVILLSEINAKTQVPMQRINLPKGLIKG